MTSSTAARDIRERLVDLIATNTGVDRKLIAHDASIWLHFPPGEGRNEAPAVTSFVAAVKAEFDVYLTEEELEDPSVDGLARSIHGKLANPAASIEAWKEDRAGMVKGMWWVFAFWTLLVGPMVVFGASGPWSRRLIVAGGMAFVMNGAFYLIYRSQLKKFDAADPRKRSGVNG